VYSVLRGELRCFGRGMRFVTGALLVVCALVKMQNIPMCRCGSDDRCFQLTERCRPSESWC